MRWRATPAYSLCPDSSIGAPCLPYSHSVLLHASTGKGAIKAMLSPEYAKQKKVIKVTSELEAAEVLHQLIPW